MLAVGRGSALLAYSSVSRDPRGRILEWSVDRYSAGKIAVSVGNSWNLNPLTWTTPDEAEVCRYSQPSRSAMAFIASISRC